MQQAIKDISLNKFGIQQRLVSEADAEFIFSLRTDPVLSQYLSKTTGTVEDQRRWISSYKQREANGEEYYFITFYEGMPQGLNRLYNFDHESFEVGSWLFRRDAPGAVAILADIAVRDFGFEELKFNNCRFEVNENNKSVLNYHKLFGPELYEKEGESLKFRLSKEKYLIARSKILKIYKYGN